MNEKLQLIDRIKLFFVGDSFALNLITILALSALWVYDFIFTLLDPYPGVYADIYQTLYYRYSHFLYIGIGLIIFAIVAFKARGLDHRNKIRFASSLLTATNLIHSLLIVVLGATFLYVLSCRFSLFGFSEHGSMLGCFDEGLYFGIVLVTILCVIPVKIILLILHLRKEKKNRELNQSAG